MTTELPQAAITELNNSVVLGVGPRHISSKLSVIESREVSGLLPITLGKLREMEMPLGHIDGALAEMSMSQEIWDQERPVLHPHFEIKSMAGEDRVWSSNEIINWMLERTEEEAIELLEVIQVSGDRNGFVIFENGNVLTNGNVVEAARKEVIDVLVFPMSADRIIRSTPVNGDENRLGMFEVSKETSMVLDVLNNMIFEEALVEFSQYVKERFDLASGEGIGAIVNWANTDLYILRALMVQYMEHQGFNYKEHYKETLAKNSYNYPSSFFSEDMKQFLQNNGLDYIQAGKVFQEVLREMRNKKAEEAGVMGTYLELFHVEFPQGASADRAIEWAMNNLPDDLWLKINECLESKNDILI